MIGIIDYGSGNLRSVSKALQNEGAEVKLVQSPNEFAGVKAIVLPGVGAFGDCVKNLKAQELWQPIQQWLNEEKPFFGICLGYQLLFESSEETPDMSGFGYFKGRVKRFTANDLKVPHMGWNTLQLVQKDALLWKNLPVDPYVFFVHSFFPEPEDSSIVTSRCSYGENFAASVSRGNISAVQFHPEKSQANGLTILKNFVTAFS